MQVGDVFLSRRLDRVKVVGIQNPVLLFELSGIAGNADRDELLFHQTWKEAISHFEQRHFTEAAGLFGGMVKQRPNDGVAALYAKRSLGFLQELPAPDWDGVFSLSEK
jgi:adenylate cyclase